MVSDLQRETPKPRPGLSDNAARRASASSGSKIQHQGWRALLPSGRGHEKAAESCWCL